MAPASCQSEPRRPGCGPGVTGLGQARLFLFLSLGSGLSNWEQAGTLARETALYRALRPHLAGVHLVSYGRDDRRRGGELGGLIIHDNRMRLPGALYAKLLQSGLTIRGRGPAVVKTNQMQGADVALMAARRAGYGFICRAGYLPSNIALWRQGPDSAEAKRFRELEARVMRAADRVALTTPAMAAEVCQRYGVDPAKVRVVPNFVDTELFRPPSADDGSREENLLLYVGRLHEEKNLGALFQAMAGQGLRLLLAGEGPSRPALETLAGQLKLRVEFLGRVENADLPGLMARAAAFVLPSKGEHHPKALLEAMSAGMAVLGSDAPGIRELIEPGRTGWLCGTSAEEMVRGLSDLMADSQQRARRGAAAREYVVENFSLSRVLELELALLAEVVG